MIKSQKSLKKYNENETVVNPDKNFFDFVSLSFILAYLIIDFFPYFKTYEIIKPQFLYLTGLNIVIGLFVYFNQSFFSANLLGIFKKSNLLKVYLGFIFLSAVSIFTAKNVSLGIEAIAEIFVVFVMVVNLAIILSGRFYLLYKVAFLVGLSALFQSSIALYHFQDIAQSKSVSEALNSEFLKGNTGNINIFSASLMFKIPFLFIAVTHYNSLKKWLIVIALTFSFVLIFFINARASLLSLLFLLVIYLFFYLKTNPFIKTTVLKLTCIIFPLIISFAVSKYTFKKAQLSGRYSSAIERLQQIDLQESSINRRLVFYQGALRIINENPVMGIGLGNYRIESIPYEMASSYNIALHAHNDFLELASETGVVNGFLYLSMFVLILVVNLNRIFKSNDNEIQFVAFLALMLLIVYGIDATFNFPFYRPTMQICFGLLMALTLVNKNGIFQKDQPVTNKTWLILPLMALIPLYSTYYAYRTSNLEYLIQTDDINFNDKGVLNGDEVIKRIPKIPNVFLGSEAYVEYAGIYYFREGNYDKAILYLDSANKINPHLGRPNYYKYLVALKTNQIDSAYNYIKAAFYIRPINSVFFKHAVDLALVKKDTSEILKMYQTSLKYGKNGDNWVNALNALEQTGYSAKGLEIFTNNGKTVFAKDSVVVSKLNARRITDLIIKGQAFFASGKPDLALRTYKEGLKIEAKNIYIKQNIGFYYYNLGNYAEAVNNFAQALLTPGLYDGKTEYYMAISYSKINDNNNACKYLSLAKSKGFQVNALAENIKCIN